MDNIGDWLYIVLLVIAGVSGLFNSGKKKRTTAFPDPSGNEPAYEPERQESKSFRELVEEMAAEKPVAPFPPSAASEPLFSTAEKEKRRRSTPPPPPFLTAENAFSSRPAALSPNRGLPSEEESGNVPALSFSDRDELKRAIIISEILNRKY